MSVASGKRAAMNIDDDVDFITEQIQRLEELAEQNSDRDQLNDEDVYDLSVRWGAALAGRLPRLAYFSSSGLLSDHDERRFQSLCEELRELSPLVERFKLARPDLEDCPDARAGGRHHRKKHPPKRRRFLRP